MKLLQYKISYKSLAITLLLFAAIPLTISLMNQQQKLKASADQIDPSSVGLQVKTISYNTSSGANKQLTFAIWYPTTTNSSRYGYNRLAPAGKVALDAPVKKNSEGYPLIVFSHGLGGCGYQSAYITEHLASYGYIVAAPDHEDISLCSIKGLRRPSQELPTGDFMKNYPNRPNDIKAVIDEMLRLSSNSDSVFYNTINREKVGMAGHSLGGWTASGVSGALSSYKDSRIKALMLYAPAIFDYSTSELANIKIPTMYLLGENDALVGKLPRTPENYGYPNANPPKYMGVIKRANHFSFSDSECTLKINTSWCSRHDSTANVVVDYTKAFFDKYLNGDNTADSILQVQAPQFVRYSFQSP